MGPKKAGLKLLIDPEVSRRIVEIYHYSIEKWGLSVAEGYYLELRRAIASLKEDWAQCPLVSSDEEWRFKLVKNSSSQDGHVIVFKINRAAETLYVLHLIHTKQNWREEI